jgi:hypothetical protein
MQERVSRSWQILLVKIRLLSASAGFFSVILLHASGETLTFPENAQQKELKYQDCPSWHIVCASLMQLESISVS